MGFFDTFKMKSKSGQESTTGMYERTKSAFYGRSKPDGDDEAELPNFRVMAGQAKSFSHGARPKRQDSSSIQSKPDAPAPQVNYTNIGQFSNKVEIYAGSVSTVYKAVCVQTGAKVVIKAYHKAKMNERHFHKLDREIDIQRALDGDYVCDLYGIFEDSHCKYLVMEFCEGGDLFKKMLMKGGRLEEAYVCTDIIVPLLRVLEKMHSLNIVHRDIKPENIFLSGNGKFKLGDFGLAIDTSKEIPFCRSGTLDYMAPEVLVNPSTRLEEGRATLTQLNERSIRPYGSRVDVWAAGVLAYELVKGAPPFEVDDESRTVALILTSNDIRFPRRYSPEWADFCRAALTKKPSKRPSASMLLEHPWVLQHMANALGGPQPRPTKEQLLDPLPINSGSLAHRDTSSDRRVGFSPNTTASNSSKKSSGNLAMGDMQDALRNLRSEFGGNVAATSNIDMRQMVGKGSVSFTVPRENYTGVPVQQLTKEELGETGAASGMKARLKFYMNRQKC